MSTNNDKYDFIFELLNNKKLTTNQRENILHLSSFEIIKDKERGDILEERIKRIEDLINENHNNIINDDAIEESQPFYKVNEISIISSNNEKNIKPRKVKTVSSRIDEVKDIEYNTSHFPKIVNDTDKVKLIKYLNPSSLYKYLFEFNQNRILKSTCHEIDDNALADINEYCRTETYDFHKYLEKIISAFEEHDKKYNCIFSTKSIIRGYITGKDYYKNQLKNGWSSDNIHISWADSSLYDWALINKIPPNSSQEYFKTKRKKGFEIKAFTSKLSNKRIQTFRELVLYFKCLFHIRADNSLKSILCNINENNGFNEKIIFHIDDDTFPSNIELFTDVDKLIQGYIKLVKLIIEQHTKDSKPEVKLSFYEIGNSVCLSIHHLNNTYNKTIQNTLERRGQSYTDLIAKQLNGMCNLYLKADFGREEKAEINLWNGKKMNANTGSLNNFTGGVEHIFEFCKK